MSRRKGMGRGDANAWSRLVGDYGRGVGLVARERRKALAWANGLAVGW